MATETATATASASANPPLPPLALDHLVVAARSLDEAAAWCEAMFGVAPVGGGAHVGIGTHNRLLPLAGAMFPRCYLELIAVDPGQPEPAARRWFDLDDPALREALEAGPRLVHWVARVEATGTIEAARAALVARGVDPGAVVAASRDTPRGTLSWRITRRADGGRPARGAVPSLIEWGARHPCDGLPPGEVEIRAVRLGGIDAATASGLGAGTDSGADAAPLAVTLQAPRGTVELASPRESSRPA